MKYQKVQHVNNELIFRDHGQAGKCQSVNNELMFWDHDICIYPRNYSEIHEISKNATCKNVNNELIFRDHGITICIYEFQN